MGTSGINTLAFLQRAFGIRPRYKPFESIEGRAKQVLIALNSPVGSLRFKLALAHLRVEWDVTSVTFARVPDRLRLQNRLIELAPVDTIARTLCIRFLAEATLPGLFASILARAQAKQVQEVQIYIDKQDSQAFAVSEVTPVGLVQYGTLPLEVGYRLLELFLIVDTAGYREVRPYLPRTLAGPENVLFKWITGNHVHITLS